MNLTEEQIEVLVELCNNLFSDMSSLEKIKLLIGNDEAMLLKVLGGLNER